MNKTSFISHPRTWLNSLPIEDPLERRMAFLLQVILLGLMAVVVLATIIYVTLPIYSTSEKLNTLKNDFWGFLVVALPFGLLRRGYFRGSVLIIIILLLITPTLAVTVVFNLLNSGGLLIQFTLAIILAGLLVGRLALLLTFGLSTVVVGFSAFQEQNAVPQLMAANFEIAINFILFNGLIALFLDRFGVTMRTALNSALESESKLKNEINKRTQAAQSLAEGEEHYYKLIDHARDVIFTISMDGRITSLNPSFEVFTGWSRAEWLNRTFDELVAEEDRGRAHDQFNRILHGEPLRALRLQFHTRFGKVLVVEMNISPQFKDDQVVGLLGIARDMTQEQQAEDALKASERRFRALVENGWDAFTLADAQGTIRYASPSTQRVMGYTPEEFVGLNAFTLFHPDDLALARAKLIEVLQAPRNVIVAQVRARHKDGTWRWMEGIVTNLFGEPDVQALVTNYRDITESKQAEQALRDSHERLQLFFDQSVVGFFFSMLDEPKEWNDSVNKDEVLDYVFTYQHITEVNNAMLEQYGATRENFLGRTANDFFGHDLEQGRRFRRRLFDAGHLHLDTEEHKDDGTPIWIEGDYVCIYDERGRISGMFGIQRDITKRKHVEENLRASEDRFYKVFEENSVAMIISNPVGEITLVNEQAHRMLGYDVDELISMNIEQLVPENFRNIHVHQRTTYNQHPSIRQMSGRELKARHKDGTEFPIEIGLAPLNMIGDTFFLASIVDLTELKQAGETLRQSEELFSTMFRYSPIPVALASFPGGKIKDINEAFCDMFGFTREECIGQSSDEVGMIDADARRKVYELLKDGQAIRNVDTTARRKNGDGLNLLISVSFVTIEGEKYSLSSLIDITERKQAEAKVRQSEERFRALTESNWDGVVLFSAEGSILYSSPAANRILGYEPDAIVGRTAFEFIHPDDQVLAAEKLMISLQQPRRSINIQARILHKNGTWRWMEGVFTNLLDVPSVQAIVNNYRDITERKLAEEKLEQQNQRLKILREIDGAILAADSIESIIGAAVSHVRELIGCRRAGMALLDWETKEVVVFNRQTVGNTAISQGTRMPLMLFQDMFQILSKNQPVVITDLTELPELLPLFQTLSQEGWRSICILPLFSQGSLIGGFNMASEIPGFFEEERLSLGREVANQMAIAITQNNLLNARKRAEEKLRTQNQRLTVLREIDGAILAADSVENIVGAALDYIRELIYCEHANLALIEWEKNEAVNFDVRDAKESAITKGARVPLDLIKDILQVLSQNQPVIMDDLIILPDPRPQINFFIKEGLRSRCILPLFSQRKLIGALTLSSAIPNYFDLEKISLGREVANQMAIAITQSRMIDNLQQLNADLKQRALEREQLISELTAKNAELERFTYTASHDLRSPLVTIKGFLGYLEQDTANGNMERLKSDTKRIASAVDKMNQLLDDLLELSRIGRLINPSEVIPFEEIVHTALDLVEERVRKQDIQVELQPNLPTVYGDRVRLVEVLQYLIENAAKYMGNQPSPQIEIGVRRDQQDGMPVFYVQDNGIGIESVYHEKVFGLFNKLDARSPGTGIGLALVKRIVEFHGGRVWVESKEGEGATFYFTLPKRESK